MSKREKGFYVLKQTHVRQSPRFGTNGRGRCDFRPFFKIVFSAFGRYCGLQFLPSIALSVSGFRQK